MEWVQKWKDYDVVCKQPKDSPKELSCELKKRVGEEVLHGKVDFAWESDGKPRITGMEGNPKVIEECAQFAASKIIVEMK